MTFERVLALVAGLALVIVAAALLAPRSAERRRMAGGAWARRNLAWVEPRFVPELDAWFDRRRRRGGVMALVAGLLIAALPTAAVSDGPPVSLWLVVILTGSVVTLLSARDFSRPFVTPESAVRTARMRQVSVDDYAPASTRVLAWVAAGVSLMIGVAVARFGDGGSSYDRWGLIACAVLVVAGLVVAEVAGRHISARPEPAHGAADLYWQDALRAESIQAGFRGVAMWGGQISVASSTYHGVGHPLAIVADLAGLAVLIAFVSVTFRHPYMSWPRQRLWPDLATGQVMLPTDPLPEEATS